MDSDDVAEVQPHDTNSISLKPLNEPHPTNVQPHEKVPASPAPPSDDEDDEQAIIDQAAAEAAQFEEGN